MLPLSLKQSNAGWECSIQLLPYLHDIQKTLFRFQPSPSLYSPCVLNLSCSAGKKQNSSAQEEEEAKGGCPSIKQYLHKKAWNSVLWPSNRKFPLKKVLGDSIWTFFSDKYLFFRNAAPVSVVTKYLLLNISLDHLKYQTGEDTERSIFFLLDTIYSSGRKSHQLRTVP